MQLIQRGIYNQNNILHLIIATSPQDGTNSYKRYYTYSYVAIYIVGIYRFKGGSLKQAVWAGVGAPSLHFKAFLKSYILI